MGQQARDTLHHVINVASCFHSVRSTFPEALLFLWHRFPLLLPLPTWGYGYSTSIALEAHGHDVITCSLTYLVRLHAIRLGPMKSH